MKNCATCQTPTAIGKLTWGKAKKLYGGPVCSPCIQKGVLSK